MPLTPATLTIESSSTAADKVRADLLAVPVFADRRLGPGADVVAAALGGDLAEFMAEADFDGKRGETLAVPTQGKLGAKAVMLVGVGEQDTFDLDAIRRAGAALAKRGAEGREGRDHDARRRARVARPRRRRAGARRRRRTSARTSSSSTRPTRQPSKLTRVVVLGRTNAKVKAGLARGSRIAAAVRWARDLVNEPAGGEVTRRGGEPRQGSRTALRA